MFSKTVWINIILAGVVSFFIMKTHDVWTGGDASPGDAGQTLKPHAKSEPGIVRKKVSPESSYKVIMDKNLFTRERTEIITPQKTEEKKKEKPKVKEISVSGKRITLFGIILMEGHRSALISNPVRNADEPRDRWVKVGEQLGDLKVTQINRESIHLKGSNQTYKILLYDKKKARGASMAKAQTKPTVVSTKPDKAPTKIEAPKKPRKQETKSEEDLVEYKTVTTPFGSFKVKKKRKNIK